MSSGEFFILAKQKMGSTHKPDLHFYLQDGLRFEIFCLCFAFGYNFHSSKSKSNNSD